MAYPLRSDTNAVTNATNQNLASKLGGALNEWLEDSGPSAIFRTCESCNFMSKKGPALCGKFNMTPPVGVIMTGCNHHVDEAEIPL